MKPTVKPSNPRFSSGPCAKRPGWSLAALEDAALGRSHRAKIGKSKLKEVIDRSKAILGIPADYVLGIVPASDTGAIEMAMWSMLGARGADVLVWESFGKGWATDCKKQLKLADLNIIEAPYGEICDLSKLDWTRDVVFTWNGTTSGVRVPNADWIPANREGLAICDATSATFAMDLDFSKLDVVTWSWQKALGGEGAHGMLALSPRAVERLQTYKPSWPLPKIFQLTKDGKLIDGIFSGETINTPSMLAVEDALDGLKWAEQIGGLKSLIERSENNLKLLAEWVEKSDWIDFLCGDKATRSCTSVTFKIRDSWYQGLSADAQAKALKDFTALLEKEAVAYDIGAYRDAPAGLRIWAGATVESADIKALLPWLDWAWAEIKQSQAKAA
ncbi:MAG: phosphoserine transaminase [Pseudomonadota bacterium]